MKAKLQIAFIVVGMAVSVFICVAALSQARRQAAREVSLPKGWKPRTTEYKKLLDDINQGKRLLDDGKFDAAESAFAAIIQKYDANKHLDKRHVYEAHLRLGMALRGQGKHKAALEQFRQVIDECEWRYQKARGWIGLGRTYVAMGAPDQALAKFQRVIDSFSEDIHACPESYMAMAKVHIAAGDLGKATAALERIIRDYPGSEREWEIEAKAVLKDVAKLQAERRGALLAKALEAPGVKHLAGPIAQDTVLGKGVYVASETLVVAKGATLELQPGATLKFMLGAPLIVRGALVCQGAARDPVVLTSASESPGPFSWVGVLIEPESGAASSFSHCRIEHAKGGVECDGASPTLADCAIVGTGQCGLRAKNKSEAKVLRCTIEKGEGDGVQCVRRTKALLEGNTIRGNRGTGLSISILCDVQAKGNTIAANRGYGIHCVESTGSVLVGNTVQGNRRAGILCHHSSPPVTSNVIENNVGPGLACQTGASPQVAGNTIRGNTSGGIACKDSSSPSIVGNRIEGNVAFGIACERASAPTIQGNTIAGNSGPGIVAKDSSAPVIHGNNITGHKRWALRNDGSAQIDASGNWWGTANLGEIARRVFDAADTPAAGKVKLEPIRSGPAAVKE